MNLFSDCDLHVYLFLTEYLFVIDPELKQFESIEALKNRHESVEEDDSPLTDEVISSICASCFINPKIPFLPSLITSILTCCS